MRLNKYQREQVRLRYGGLCAYCGEELGTRWHADHLISVVREFVFAGGGTKNTGRLLRPENDHLDNMMPACVPCNIDKHSMALEAWRAKLSRSCEVLANNHPTYRHAVRFGLVRETGARVLFYFERLVGDGTKIPPTGELCACEACDRTFDPLGVPAAIAAGWRPAGDGWRCPGHAPDAGANE